MKKLFGNWAYLFKLTAKEYEASINALNIFFGAVIGISLGSIGDIPTLGYVQLLVITSAAVTSILFVCYSERQYFSVLTTISALGVMWWLDRADDSLFDLPPKLIPTLGVWAAMSLVTRYAKVVDDSGDQD